MHHGLPKECPSHTNDSNGRHRRTPGNIPYVSLDDGKTRYYADRFYLDAPTNLLEHQLASEQVEHDIFDVDYCNFCGEQVSTKENVATSSKQKDGVQKPSSKSSARPLFDRAKFIQSLDLSAAIIGTYTIGDSDFLSTEFPKFFPPSSDVDKERKGLKTVPTLVLHGHRGFKLHQKDYCIPTETNQRLQKQETYRRNSSGMQVTSTSNQMHTRKINQSSPLCNHTDKIIRAINFVKEELVKEPVLTYDNNVLDLTVPTRKKQKRRRRSMSIVQLDSLNKSNYPVAIELSKDISRQLYSDEIDSNYKVGLGFMHRITDKGNAAVDAEVGELASTIESKERFLDSPLHTPLMTVKRKHYQNFNSDGNFQSTEPLQSQFGAMKENSKILSMQTSPTSSPSFKQRTSPSSLLSASIASPSSSSIPLKSIKHDVNHIKSVSYSFFDHLTDDDESVGKVIRFRKNEPVNEPCEKVRLNESIKRGRKRNGCNEPLACSVFGGTVFFTRILSQWNPSVSQKRYNAERDRKISLFDKDQVMIDEQVTEKNSSDKDCNEDKNLAKSFLRDKYTSLGNGKAEEIKLETARGVHHPKFFLLFERRGSLIVIISTSNLAPQNSLDASWVQRFEPRQSHFLCNNAATTENVDFGMTHDFGVILTDFLKRQSDAAEVGFMLPDPFLRRFVPGLSNGLSELNRRYNFEDAQVHLVSTVPGDYSACLPTKIHDNYTFPCRITYGPQRVAYILSRILNKDHIRSACASTPSALHCRRESGMAAVMPWLPQMLVKKCGKLIMQPTSLGGSWTTEDLELVIKLYLQPSSSDASNINNGPLEQTDIVWPSVDYFEKMNEHLRSLRDKHTGQQVPTYEPAEDSTRRRCYVFLSSTSFINLDRPCISRMSLFEPSYPPQMASYRSASVHFKSVCRLFCLSDEKPRIKALRHEGLSQNDKCNDSDSKYLFWFMLTSACLTKGAQGQPTLYRGLESDSMSYANFELGVLFCSRLLGDRVNDRLYVFNPQLNGCQCGIGKRWYKSLLRENVMKDQGNQPTSYNIDNSPSFLKSVRKVHLPIPYRLHPRPYQEDPEMDVMSYTPYFHDIPWGTGHVGNMKLTPLGQQLAYENSMRE